VSADSCSDLRVENDARTYHVAAHIESIVKNHWQIKSSLLYPHEQEKEFVECL
jgi:hypothetical protein